KLSENFPSQDLRDLRVVNGNGDDFVSSSSHMSGYIMRGLIPMRFRLDSEHRNGPRFANYLENPRAVGNEIGLPVGHRLLPHFSVHCACCTPRSSRNFAVDALLNPQQITTRR